MTICTSPLTATLSSHPPFFCSGPFSRLWEVPCRGTCRMIKVCWPPLPLSSLPHLYVPYPNFICIIF